MKSDGAAEPGRVKGQWPFLYTGREAPRRPRAALPGRQPSERALHASPLAVQERERSALRVPGHPSYSGDWLHQSGRFGAAWARISTDKHANGA